jgi:hypothetical protein
MSQRIHRNNSYSLFILSGLYIFCFGSRDLSRARPQHLPRNATYKVGCDIYVPLRDHLHLLNVAGCDDRRDVCRD